MNWRSLRQAVAEVAGNPRRFRVSRARRCPICGKPDYCLASDSIALCPRIAEGSIRKVGQFGYLHVLSQTAIASVQTAPSAPTPRSPEELDETFRPLAEKYHRRGRRDLWLLAEDLGVTTDSLVRLGVGFLEYRGQPTWTVPERNGHGLVIGLSLRMGLGKAAAKRTWPGSRRGLCYPEEPEELLGTLYVVEGMSDTAACLSHGHLAVGRPSSTGGAKMLAELIASRGGGLAEVVVVGENDRRPHSALGEIQRRSHNPLCSGCESCWPGLHGARAIASALQAALPWGTIEVRLAMPPADCKDAREWLSGRKSKKVPLQSYPGRL